MRVLIVHRGVLPGPGRAVTGGALRAWRHGQALQQAGHEVFYLSPAAETPGGYSDIRDLTWRARHLTADRIVCVSMDAAPALGTLGVPLAVDLYQARLLESPFAGRLARAGVQYLRALAVGSTFIVTHPRERWSWLSVMALAGIDVRSDPVLVVPPVAPAPPERKTSAEPMFVTGGSSWPWHDPRPALRRVLDHLDRRGTGRLVWFGGAPLLSDALDAPESEVKRVWSLPEHPRLERAGWVPYTELLRRYGQATAAIDLAAAHPARALRISHRQVDYLGCRLPVLTSPDAAIAEDLGEAGIVTEDVEGGIDRFLDDPPAVQAMRAAAAHRVEQRYASA
ncbi:MAG: hypothetical protein AAFV53_41815, partial [Myxococcota bacterium]